MWRSERNIRLAWLPSERTVEASRRWLVQHGPGCQGSWCGLRDHLDRAAWDHALADAVARTGPTSWSPRAS